jgi:hypothetical protein
MVPFRSPGLSMARQGQREEPSISHLEREEGLWLEKPHMLAFGARARPQEMVQHMTPCLREEEGVMSPRWSEKRKGMLLR